MLPSFTSPVDQENGLLVDGRLRTSAPDLFGAGDVANHLHPLFGRIRVEHYNNGEKMGQAAARSMLGSTDPYDYVHTFWSDQYEHKLRVRRSRHGMGRLRDPGQPGGGKAGRLLPAGRSAAGGGRRRPRRGPELDTDSEMAAAARLVGMRARPDAGQLADEGIDLWSLAE